MPEAKQSIPLSLQTFRRLPGYYQYLQGLEHRETGYIAASALANEMGLSEVQVRKDLAAVSKSPGKPRRGFSVKDLTQCIAQYLGYHRRQEAVLVGAGKLGRALIGYEGFEEYGVRIVAAFDQTGISEADHIYPMDRLEPYCRAHEIRIGIITVPADQAQGVCDRLVESGVLAVLNFAPTHLHAPGSVLVENENMAASLALLSRHLNKSDEQEVAP